MRISDWSSDVCSSDLLVLSRPLSGSPSGPWTGREGWREDGVVRTDERRPSSGVLRIVAASLIAVLLVLSVSPPAGAQDSGESPVGELIPKPNSGAEPGASGDQGGSIQAGLLGLLELRSASCRDMVVHNV